MQKRKLMTLRNRCRLCRKSVPWCKRCGLWTACELSKRFNRNSLSWFHQMMATRGVGGQCGVSLGPHKIFQLVKKAGALCHIRDLTNNLTSAAAQELGDICNSHVRYAEAAGMHAAPATVA